MPSEYLSGYQIPHILTPEPQPDDARVTIKPSANVSKPTMSTNRFLPPGKKGTEVMENVKEVPVVASQRNLKRKISELPEGELKDFVMFQGRDESYPDDLNKLILPLSCQLCKAQMTSIKSAKDHYESKAHDRHISAWLAKNYTEMGLQTPPIKRLVKQGPTGPNAFHCNLCDLPLTSKTHARQHYSGRKHQLVEQKGSKPSGAGFYNAEGKWVRTGTKAEVVADDGRFGIGELFIKAAVVAELEAAKKENKFSDEQQIEAKTLVVDESLTCKICNISVTSASQIKMHLEGAKHKKNLRKQNLDDEATKTLPPSSESEQSTAAVPNADEELLSMYRTPSGSYYCELCNISCTISILQQHLQGKRHLKAVRQQAVKPPST